MKKAVMYGAGNIGRDPVRKLSSNDRMIGSSTLCLKHEIVPVYISLGIAAGFIFAPPADEMALRVQKTVLDYGIEKSIAACSMSEPLL